MEERGVGQGGRSLRSHDACNTRQPSDGRVMEVWREGNMQTLWGAVE